MTGRHVFTKMWVFPFFFVSTDFKAKMNKSKINKYKINNNNKTNTKHEFNVKYERHKQDISKDRKLQIT
jgi:hypothetical protein